MAQALVSAVLEKLSSTIMDKVLEEVRILTSLKEDMEEFERNLRALSTLLEDAEEKQMSNNLIKSWLDELKQASYDMEDILDEWNLSLMKQQVPAVEIPSTLINKKVCSFFSCLSCSRLPTYHQVGVKMRAINESLRKISARKEMFDLTTREAAAAQPHSALAGRRRETTSLADASEFMGRYKVKEEIKRRILLKGDEEVQSICMVGMGGIGKTTIAQVIFNEIEVLKENEERKEWHFDKKIWVCVTDIFDEKTLASAIITELNGVDRTSAYREGTIKLQTLMDGLCESISKKKFFLVLDDVWNDKDEDWKNLKLAFKKGAPGSRILVTTRKDTVARSMQSTSTFPIKELSDEVCCSILTNIALSGKSKEEREHLASTAREIAKRCRGLPLAAKTLGSLLRDKTAKRDWQNVLTNKVWESELILNKDIFAPLLLSYYDLPPSIRQCFVYCSIFPKDTELLKSTLVFHWMAHGFLGSKDNADLEGKGEEYFDCLVARSLFQDLRYEGGYIHSGKMHHLVHDFAQLLMQNESMIREVKAKEGNLMIESPGGTVRYLTLMIGTGASFQSTSQGEKLRGLVTFGDNPAASEEQLLHLFDRSRVLRIIDFAQSGMNLVEGLPAEIRKLVHLRHLNLAATIGLSELPEAICELSCLQYLNLMYCSQLKKLPDGIGKLTNLMYLLTWGCYNLSYYPKGVAKLTSLKGVMEAIVRVGDDPTNLCIGDLKSLDKLQLLWVVMVGYDEIVDPEKVMRAQLHSRMQELKQLYIRFEDLGLNGVQNLNGEQNLRQGLRLSSHFQFNTLYFTKDFCKDVIQIGRSLPANNLTLGSYNSYLKLASINHRAVELKQLEELLEKKRRGF